MESNLLRNAVEVQGQVILPGESSLSTEESQPVTIETEQVPLGYEEDNCTFHVLMLGLTFAFVIYNLVRVFQRAKASTKSTTEVSTEV